MVVVTHEMVFAREVADWIVTMVELSKEIGQMNSLIIQKSNVQKNSYKQSC